MPHNQRSKKRRRIARMLVGVWIGVFGIYLCVLFSHYSSITMFDEDSSTYIHPQKNSMISASKKLDTLSDQLISQNDIEHSPLISQAHASETVARNNRAWIKRAFQTHTEAERPSISKDDSVLRKSSVVNEPLMVESTTDDAQNQLKIWQAEANPCASFNQTRLSPTHGCQRNPDTRITYCTFSNLRIDTTRIDMDYGGEPLSDVMGRDEEKEMPRYRRGAFSTRPKPLFDIALNERYHMHFVEEVLNNMIYPTKKNKGNFDSRCVETRLGTTLMITRYEYVNLYHTLTDWWNAFSVLSSEQKDRIENVRILFLDAHAHGNLDAVWNDVFGQYEYAKHLPNGGVCFERAVLIPPGYLASIYPDSAKGNFPPRERCPNPLVTREFVSHFLSAYGLEKIKMIPGRVVIIDRQPYVSHPRSRLEETIDRQMDFSELERQLRETSKVSSIELVRFERMPFGEQIKTVREAQVLIGNHGAGLSSLIFMEEQAHVFEFSAYYLDFFEYLAEWKGINYHPLSIDGVADEGQNYLAAVDVKRTVDYVNSVL